MKRLLDSIITMATKAAALEDAADITALSTGVHQLASAYVMLKDVEIHEKYHLEAQGKIPGDEPVPFKPN